MELYWTPEAIQDRSVIYDYIETDNPTAALALDELFSEKASRLVDQPLSGRTGRVPGTLELVAHRHYMLVYEVVGNLVQVLNVVHTSRQWPSETDR